MRGMKRGGRMIDKLCEYLTNKIRKEIPDIDDERAEVINYGLQLMLGEIPKTLIILLIAYALGVFKLSLLASSLLSSPFFSIFSSMLFSSFLFCIFNRGLIRLRI